MKKFLFGMAILLSIAPSLAVAAPKSTPPGSGKIALLNSAIFSADFFQRRYGPAGSCTVGTFLGRDEYRRYFLGWRYVLSGQPDNALIGLPTDPTVYDYQVIPDIALTDGSLDQFDVLIMSNDASLDDDEESAIQKWVQRGGNLIATFGSGYKDIILDPREDDGLKLQKGGTSGLHELWHDPMTKAFGSQAITPNDPTSPGIDVKLTTIAGPTAGFGLGVMSYGAEANLLGQRPYGFNDALAFLNFTPADAWSRPQPAILSTKFSKGNVVYMAFAPEFIVSLAFDLAGHCPGDASYPGASLPLTPGPQAADFPNGFVGPSATRVGPLMQLMKQTIDYMLTN